MGIEVETSAGRIVGEERGGVVAFRGMPYARVPGRFRDAELVESWEGVLDGSKVPPCSPQPDLGAAMASGGGGEAHDEDRLYVSVHRPAQDGAPRPVMVWIHGGGFIMGSPGTPLYDPQHLVRAGDVIVVTLNYRLGVLGSLDTSSLGLDVDGLNLHLRDQIVALRWVRQHIGDFGGDPGRVTVFGESAGATSVACLMGSPAAQGLFQRAIAQSCAAGVLMQPPQAERVAEVVLAQAPEAHGDPERLLGLPREQLFAASLRASGELMSEGVRLAFVPTSGRNVITTHPIDAVAAGAGDDVALIVGSNLDEWRYFGAGDRRLDAMDREATRTLVTKRLGRDDPRSAERAERLLEAYGWPAGAEANAYEVFCAIEGDRIYRNSGLALADAVAQRGVDAFTYLLTWASPNRRYGASHTVDLPFVFGTLDVPDMARFVGDGPEARALSAAMVQAWVNFARGGAPGAGDLPEWPRHDTAARPTMMLGRQPHVEQDPYAERRRAWASVGSDR